MVCEKWLVLIKNVFFEKFDRNLDEVFKDALETTSEKGWLIHDQQNVKLTREGRFLGNNVFREFL